MKGARYLVAASATTLALIMGYSGMNGAQISPAAAANEGQKVPNFRLSDENLVAHELYTMADAPAVVLITQGDGCPVVRNDVAAFNALKAKYAAKGVEFFMINSNIQDSREDIKDEAKEFGYDMPVLKDANQLVGEALHFERTAEVIIIDPKTWQIVYRGPVDDRVTYERQKTRASNHWADDALNSFLAGKPVEVAQRPAPGCLINLVSAGHESEFKNISYSREIAPIINEKCVSCHQDGGIGPMQLTSYTKVKGFAPMIREVLYTDRMPPFHADPEIGEFKHDMSLSSDQIKTLVHWIDAGAPRGDGPDLLAESEHVAPQWPLGKPDLILDIPAYDIPASGIVDYQHPWVANPLTEGRWLRASTIKVGERQGVHHVLTGMLKDVPDGPRSSEANWGASVGGYAVGAESEIAPSDVGTYLEPGGAIGFQMHYTPFGKEAVDHTQIGLYFYPKGEEPTYVMHNAVIADPSISIPPNTDEHAEIAYVTFPHDALLYSTFPHAHYRGESAKVWLEDPQGNRKLLVALPKYDFNWQRSYDFVTPVPVKAGSKLIFQVLYDNTKRNAANPDPNRTVPWGEQSFDEMLYLAYRYRWTDETRTARVDYDRELNDSRMLGILDDNIDGKVEVAELEGRAMGAPLKQAFAMLDRNGDGALDAQELAVAQNMGRRGQQRAER